MRKNLNGEQKISKFFLISVIAIFVLILSFPIVVTILTSLKSTAEVHTIPATWIPQKLLFRNYLEIFSKLDLVSALKSSLVVSISVASRSKFISLIQCKTPDLFSVIIFLIFICCKN